MPTEEAFLTRLAVHPDDDTTRLVYAGWLEEHGDPRGAYLRPEVELAGLEPGPEDHAEGEARLLAARGASAATGWAYDLVLNGYPPSCRIAVIKAIRELTRCGLQEGKDLSESLPATVLIGAPRPLGRAWPGGPAELWRPLAEWQPTAGLQSLILLDYAPGQTIHVIRTLRELTGLGLTECKHLVEAPRPLLLLHNVAPDLIRRAREQFGPGVGLQVVNASP